MQDTIKQDVTQRFLEAIDLLVSRKLFTSPRDYGLKYNLSASSISDMKYNRTAVDIKHIYNIAKNYEFISVDYIMLGTGSIERVIKENNSNFLSGIELFDPMEKYASKDEIIKDLLRRVDMLELVVLRK